MLPRPFSAVLDLETGAKTPDAVIFEIGAIAFERTTFIEVSRIELKLDIPDQIIMGRVLEPDTLKFHLREGSLPAEWRGITLKNGLIRLSAWLMEQDPAHVWIQGTDFDRPILESATTMTGLDLPWPYHAVRDARTLQDLASPGYRHPKRPHRSIPDCMATLDCIAQSAVSLNLKPEAI